MYYERKRWRRVKSWSVCSYVFVSWPKGPSRIGISYTLLEIMEPQILYWQKNSVYFLGYCIYKYFNYHEILFRIPNYQESLIQDSKDWESWKLFYCEIEKLLYKLAKIVMVAIHQVAKAYRTSLFFTVQYFHKFHEKSSILWKYNHE